MMDWKLQSFFAVAGGLLVLIVGAGYKSYRYKDLPTVQESGIVFAVGTVLTAILAFMGGFDAWSKDAEGLFGLAATATAAATDADKKDDIGNMVSQVSDSMKGMTNWFQSTESSSEEDMLVGPPPF
jgi:hypothetical protein